MASSIPAPLHIIQDSRYAKQDGWELDDISLCSSGNIAVSGHNYRTDQSYVSIYGSTTTDDNSDSRDKPTLLYHKQFTDKLSWIILPWPPRYISFIKPNSTEIVTCWYNEVQVIDYNRDVVLRSRKVNGETTCLSASESQIFIGLYKSDIVNIYDNDLNEIKSIRLKGIRRDWPWDIAVAANRLCVCTEYDRAIVYSQDSGSILTEYTIGQYRRTSSIAVNLQLQIVAVLWNGKQVAVYSVSTNNCLVIFDVESGVSRIRISDKGRIVTGNTNTGEVKIYELAQFFTYDNLKVTLSSLLSESDLNVLLEYFKISEDSLIDTNDGSSKEKDKYANFLQILEEKGILHREDFHQVKEAFCHLGSHHSRMVMNFVDFYQEYAEKAILPSSTQASIDAEGGHQLQINGFSANWLVVDMSLGPDPRKMVVLSGYNKASGKTSLDCIHEEDSDASFSWLRTREFDKGNSKNSERFVSFIHENEIVTCCHNIAEIIDLNTNESKCKARLPTDDSASCITVRNKNIYIGFKDSVDILVLDADLQEKMKIKLENIEDMWPIDLAVSIGRLLVCLKYMSSSKVFLFTDVDGKKLLEYRIDVDKAQAPLSVAIHEESDLVAILWNTENEDEEYYEIDWSYPEDRTYGYLSLHSLSQGYCLSVVSVGLTVHDCDFGHCECYEGCSSGRKVRINSGCVAVLDTMSGVKFFDMKKMFTSDSVKTALCQFISSDDCQELMCSNEETGEACDNTKNECKNSDTPNVEDDEKSNCSRTENSDDEAEEDEDNDAESSDESESNSSEDDKEIRLSPRGMHVVDIILAVLTDKKHMKSDDVNVLKEDISHTISSHYARSVEKVESERNITPCLRFQDSFMFSSRCVDISFGPCDKMVVIEETEMNEMISYLYHWDGNSQAQPTMAYYRKFSETNDELSFSYLAGNKVLTFSEGVIEVCDFSLNGKVSKSLEMTKKYGTIVTCLSTKDEIFIGFKSSEIVVCDSALVEKRTITIGIKDKEWPIDITVSASRLFVCTDGSFRRALSFSEDGKMMAEYTLVHQRGNKPHSITVDEHHDLIFISWQSIQEIVTFHSLSKGHCLALLDFKDSVRFSFKNGSTRVHELDGEFYLLDQTLMFESWKNLIAAIVRSPDYCEKLQEFFQISDSEVISKAESMIDTSRKMQLWNIHRMRGLMAVLEEKGEISPEAVHGMKLAANTLNAPYTKMLCEPVEAFIQFTEKSANHVALSLLDLHKSSSSREDLNINESAVNANTPRRPVQLPQPLFHAPSLPAPRNSFSRFQDKRPHNEPDHSVSGKELSGKRARVDVAHSGESLCMEEVSVRRELHISHRQTDPLLDQIQVSLGQLMEDDPPPHPTSVPCESLAPGIGLVQGTSSGRTTMGMAMKLSLGPPSTNLTGPPLVSTFSTEVTGPSTVMTCTPSLVAASSPPVPAGPSVGASSSSVVAPMVPRVSEPSGAERSLITMSPSLAGARQALYPLETPSTLSESTTFHRVSTAVTASPHNSNMSLCPMTGLPVQVPLAVQPRIPYRMEPVAPPLSCQNSRNTQTQSIAQVEAHLNVTQAPQLCSSPIPPQMTQHMGCSFETNYRPDRSQNIQRYTAQSGRLPIPQHTLQQARHSHKQQRTQQALQFMGPAARQPAVESIVQNADQNESSVRPRIDLPPSHSLAQQTGLSQGLNFDHSIVNQGGQGLQGRNEQLRQVDNPHIHKNVPPLVQRQGNIALQQQRVEMDCETRQCEPLASDLANGQNETQTYRRECETYATKNQGFSKEMKTAIESCVHNVVSPLLKHINDTLGHLLVSSNTRCRQEDIPGTSSQSDNACDATARAGDSPDSGHDQEVRSAWESLSEYNRMSLQAFRGMTDDRAELVRRLVEMVFTEEERNNQNCFGKSGKQKLEETKLRKIRHITFYLCPIITKKTDNDKLSLEDLEWKRLCEVIDKANRHFREKLKRQARER